MRNFLREAALNILKGSKKIGVLLSIFVAGVGVIVLLISTIHLIFSLYFGWKLIPVIFGWLFLAWLVGQEEGR